MILPSAHRASSLFLCGVLSVGLLGCAPELPAPETTLGWAELPGRIVSHQPVWMIPGRSFERHPDRSAWVAQGPGSIVVHVLDPGQEPIVFGFIPQRVDGSGEGVGTEPCLVLRWDGEPVDDLLRHAEGGEIQLERTPADLTPGSHRLVVTRCPGASEGPLVIEAMGMRRGDVGFLVQPEHVLRYRYVDDLLRRGLSGSYGAEKLAGMLFDGPQRVAVRLPTAAGGRLALTLHNSGHQATAFRVEVGGEVHDGAIEPHTRERRGFDVPPGVGEVVLGTTGGANEFFLWGAATLATHVPEPPPPVVLITLDTTRRDLMATYGGPGLPHLDALAERATVFEHARTTAPWTLPSHASMFTGLYPSRHGAGVTSGHLESGIPTLAGRLRSRYYLSAGFVAGPLTSYLFGIGRGFDLYRDPEGREVAADVMVGHIESFLDEYLTTDDEPRPPLFLFANLFDPHFPYEGAATVVGGTSVSEPWQPVLAGDGAAWNRAVAGELAEDPRALAILGQRYREDALAMDAQIGRLFEGLRQRDLLDRALVILVADHGELLGEGGYLSHSGRLDPELLEIPLVVKWPGQRRGERVDELVSVVDLFPTILRAAGLEPAEGLDGLALQEEFRGALARRPYVLAEEHDRPFHKLPAKLRIAESATALEGRRHRWLRWTGGGDCFVGRSGAWSRPTPCPDPDAEALALDQRVAEALRQDEGENLELSAEERSRLEALGYLQ